MTRINLVNSKNSRRIIRDEIDKTRSLTRTCHTLTKARYEPVITPFYGEKTSKINRCEIRSLPQITCY